MAVTMKKKNDCLSVQFQETLRTSAINPIKDTFKLSTDYFAVYRNDDFVTTYDAWIYDGSESKDTVGYKMLQSYPYDTPQFREGDYIHFDYLHEGLLSTFLLMALDTATQVETIGKMKMCTNSLRFYDTLGVKHEIPAVIDLTMSGTSESESDPVRLIQGTLTVHCQLNAESALITKNMRFLFGRPGSWTAWKIVASGLNNYANIYWDDLTSARVLSITLNASEINQDNDDLVNGIAREDTTATDIPEGDSTETDHYTVAISPEETAIYQDETQVFTCSLLLDGVSTGGAFTFTDMTAIVPSTSYVFTVIDSNHFSIQNLEAYLEDSSAYVVIKCESGGYYREINLSLRGYF